MSEYSYSSTRSSRSAASSYRSRHSSYSFSSKRSSKTDLSGFSSLSGGGSWLSDCVVAAHNSSGNSNDERLASSLSGFLEHHNEVVSSISHPQSEDLMTPAEFVLIRRVPSRRTPLHSPMPPRTPSNLTSHRSTNCSPPTSAAWNS